MDSRARVEAASKARELQQQTFDAEQKKYSLGASTVYLVIQTQRDLINAQGTELRALGIPRIGRLEGLEKLQDKLKDLEKRLNDLEKKLPSR